MSDYLPQDVITNILIRLPIKSLIRCTSVCKSWRSTIKDSTFIRTHHLKLNQQHGTNQLLLLHKVASGNCKSIGHQTYIARIEQEGYTLHYDNHAFSEYCKLGFQSPTTDFPKRNSCFRVVGVCNGLVCLSDSLFFYGHTFILWNPSIRKMVTLPKPGLEYVTLGGYDACHGFAYDVTTNDYKVIRIVEDQYKDDNRILVEVYSLATGSWSSPRFVELKCSISKCSPQAFVNGALHWDASSLSCSSYRRFILAFDVGSELFREIMMPKSVDWDMFVEKDLTLRLSTSGDGKSIGLFVRYDTDVPISILQVWLMKEYGVEESWTKLVSLGPQGPHNYLPKALCFRKSGEVMLVLNPERYRYAREETRSELCSLDPVSGDITDLGLRHHQYYVVEYYQESLVLIDRNDAISSSMG